MAGEPIPREAANFKPRRCPICGKPAAEASLPFCSKRCADVDLHRWLGGVYVVPTDEPSETEPGDEA